VPSVGRRRGRHRAPTLLGRLSNFITPYALIALGLGAIFAIGWGAVAQFTTPDLASTSVSVPGQDEFVGPVQISVSFTDLPPDNKDCRSFFDQEDAQKYFIAQGGPTSDPDSLDLDKDGQACENYPYKNSSAAVKEPNSNDQQS
jgi:hypothetical protein